MSRFLSTTYLESPVGAARDNYIVSHLTGPHSSRVTRQSPQTLAGGGGPHLQSVVITSAHNSVSTELKTCDHVVIVTL